MNVARMCAGLATACVLAFGMTVQAQEQAGSQSAQSGQTQPSQPSQSAAAGAITVEGCLQRDTAASAAAGQSEPAMFKLADAKAAAGAESSAAADIKDEYRLQASSSVDLSQHVNHQVRVTGSVSAASGDEAPTLNVTNLEMIAASCESN